MSKERDESWGQGSDCVVVSRRHDECLRSNSNKDHLKSKLRQTSLCLWLRLKECFFY